MRRLSRHAQPVQVGLGRCIEPSPGQTALAARRQCAASGDEDIHVDQDRPRLALATPKAGSQRSSRGRLRPNPDRHGRGRARAMVRSRVARAAFHRVLEAAPKPRNSNASLPRGAHRPASQGQGRYRAHRQAMGNSWAARRARGAFGIAKPRPAAAFLVERTTGLEHATLTLARKGGAGMRWSPLQPLESKSTTRVHRWRPLGLLQSCALG